MIVQCESCETKFRLADDRIDGTGTRVRCSKCGHGFTVNSAGKIDAEESDDEIEVEVDFDFDPDTGAADSAGAGQSEPAAAPNIVAGFDDNATAISTLPMNIKAKPSDSGNAAAVQNIQIDGGEFGSALDPARTAVYKVTPDLVRQSRDTEESDPVGDAAPAASPAPAPPQGADTDFGAPGAMTSPGLSPDLFGDISGLDDLVNLNEDKQDEGPVEPMEIMGDDIVEIDSTARNPFESGTLFEKSTLLGRILSHMASTSAIMVLLVGGGYFVLGGNVSLAIAQGTTDHIELPQLEDIRATSMRAVSYPRDNMRDVLIMLGSARNDSAESPDNLYVIAELLDNKGNVVRSARAPLGVELPVADFARALSEEDLKAAYAKQARLTGAKVNPQSEFTYAVGMLEPPAIAHLLQPAIRFERAETFKIVPEPPAPPKVEAPPPPEPKPVVEPKKTKSRHKNRKSRRRSRKSTP